MTIEKLLNWIAIIVIPVLLFALTPLWNSMFAEKKKLEYWTLSKTRLNDETFGVSAKAWPEVKATYQGKELADATFVRVVLLNSGGVPIKPEDFEHPITIVASSPGKVLQHRLLKAEPISLSPKLTIVDSGVQLEPLLLNPGDMLTVELFGPDNFDIERLDGRIAGLQAISEYKREPYSGISIQQVKAISSWRTEQRPLLRVPLAALGLVTFVTLAMAVVCMHLNKIAPLAGGRLIIFFSCMTLYVTGLAGAQVLVKVLAPEEAPVWSKMVFLIAAITVPIVFGFYARKFFLGKSTISD